MAALALLLKLLYIFLRIKYQFQTKTFKEGNYEWAFSEKDCHAANKLGRGF